MCACVYTAINIPPFISPATNTYSPHPPHPHTPTPLHGHKTKHERSKTKSCLIHVHACTYMYMYYVHVHACTYMYITHCIHQVKICYRTNKQLDKLTDWQSDSHGVWAEQWSFQLREWPQMKDLTVGGDGQGLEGSASRGKLLTNHYFMGTRTCTCILYNCNITMIVVTKKA